MVFCLRASFIPFFFGVMIVYVALRTLVCAVLILGTYNPSGYSYVHWVGEGLTTTKAMIGVLLFVGYSFLSWVVLGSLGAVGTVAGLAVAGLSGYQLYLLLDPGAVSRAVVEMIVLVSLSLFVGIGVSWPALMTRLSGQIHKRYLTKRPKPPRGAA